MRSKACREPSWIRQRSTYSRVSPSSVTVIAWRSQILSNSVRGTVTGDVLRLRRPAPGAPGMPAVRCNLGDAAPARNPELDGAAAGIVEDFGASSLHPFGVRLDVFHVDAEVVDAGLVTGRPRDRPRAFVKLHHGEIGDAVGQVARGPAAFGTGVGPPEAEDFLVEAGGSVDIGHPEGDMGDAGSPSCFIHGRHPWTGPQRGARSKWPFGANSMTIPPGAMNLTGTTPGLLMTSQPSASMRSVQAERSSTEIPMW